MAWQGKVAGLIGTAALSIGFYATDAIHRIENNPTALYMAGQFWVMAGERDCGLELIERAARAGKPSAPQANIERQVETAPQMCSREPVPQKPEAAPAPSARERVTVTAKVSAPRLMLASAAPTTPPGPGALSDVALLPPVLVQAEDLPDVNEFAEAKVLVVRNGQHVLDPAFERRIKQIEMEAKRQAHKRMQLIRQRQFQEQVRAHMQRG